jgi:hypothetical protein
MIAIVGPFYAFFTVRPVQDARTLLKNASEFVIVLVPCISSEASTVEIARQADANAESAKAALQDDGRIV